MIQSGRASLTVTSTEPADCEAKIRWSADSDSAQGGFVLPTEAIAGIAALGVDLFATVNFDE